MRTLLALSTLTALLAAAGASQAAPAPAVSLSASALTVLDTHPVTLRGRLASHAAGRNVTILGRPYGSSGPTRLATVKTAAGGFWKQAVRPSIATSYQARSGGALSRSLTVGVHPAISAIEAGDGRIWTLVRPGGHFANRMIQLQERTAGRWQTVAQQPLGRYSTAVFEPRAANATVRIAFSVNEAGAGFLGSTSHRFAYQVYALTLLPSASKVLYGHAVTLNGKLHNVTPAGRITIQAWPYGRSAPVRIATVLTDLNGAWSYRVKPRTETTYQALWSGTEQSAKEVVGVMPAITVRELANGHVWTHVAAGRSLAGRSVQLQQHTGGMWQTVAQSALDRHSNAVFARSLGTSTIRIALSVNQAGRGLLGGTSHPFNYRTNAVTLALSTARVMYGSSLELSGRLTKGLAGEPVVVTARSYGSSTPHPLGTVRTGPNGRFTFRVTPRIQTAYTATWGSVASPRLTVGVSPRLALKELANGNVWAQVTAGRSLSGRKVQIQQQMADGWKTVMQMPLGKHSTAVFPVLLPASNIRLALSVNAAGAGFLAAFSHPLRYQPT